ncbi:MAG TPA: hypothetical protein ENN77_02130, partial [Candidatus Wirthbacteria bacterium]|nr:hypothetical protein [Candidatus Wirthbacteria bacterium]
SIVILVRQYLSNTTVVPDYGGEYVEGAVGRPININPVLVISDIDRDLVSLLFQGITRVDSNGKLVGDLAKSWEISEDRLSYTFYLRDNVFWHDKEPFTADDVIFTLGLITKPDFPGSFTLRNNWLGVEVQKIDDYAIKFVLQDPNAAFLENTIIGILPEHIWQDIDIQELALSNLNQVPIGTGPFSWVGFRREEDKIIGAELDFFPDYWGKKPYIGKIVFKFYDNRDDLLLAYQTKSIQGMSRLGAHNLSDVREYRNTNLLQAFFPRYQAVFFNTASEKQFLKDPVVRRALSLAVDRQQIVSEVIKNDAQIMDGPLMRSSWAYVPRSEDQPLFDPALAQNMLDEAGWLKNEDGIRQKDDMRLSFNLLTDDEEERFETAFMIQQMWQEIGVEVQVRAFVVGTFIDDYLRPRNYDSVLFGQTLSWDPDVYAFWHSSQMGENGLNIANYSDDRVDKLLEDGRRLLDSKSRVDKYHDFQQIMRTDSPAVFLYSPAFNYAVSREINNVELGFMLRPSDRFQTIANWYINTKRVRSVPVLMSGQLEPDLDESAFGSVKQAQDDTAQSAIEEDISSQDSAGEIIVANPESQGLVVIDHNTISIQVLNGNGATAGGRRLSSTLEVLGFNMSDPENADSFDYPKTTIYFANENLPKAETVRNIMVDEFGILTEMEVDLFESQVTDLVVLLGQDAAAIW